MQENERVQITIYSKEGSIPPGTVTNPGAMIGAFLLHRPLTDTNRKTYRYALQGFFAFVQRHRWKTESLTEAHIVAYKETLYATGHSVYTVNSYLAALRAFYGWLSHSGYCRNITSDIPHDKTDKNAIHKAILEKDETGRLLDLADTLPLRDRAIIYLVSYNGLRTIEVARARIRDLKAINGKNVLMVQCKGHRSADMPSVLPRPVYSAIREYLDKERPGALDGEALFTNTRTGVRKQRNGTSMRTDYAGRGLTPRTIQSIVKSALRAIGLVAEGYSAHSLRHTVANDMLQNGASIYDVQQTLHHSSAEITRIYTKITDRRLRIEKAAEMMMENIRQRN